VVDLFTSSFVHADELARSAAWQRTRAEHIAQTGLPPNAVGDGTQMLSLATPAGEEAVGTDVDAVLGRTIRPYSEERSTPKQAGIAVATVRIALAAPAPDFGMGTGDALRDEVEEELSVSATLHHLALRP